MALSRRNGHRFQASIWPGFVDAITALLLVMIFMLTIFMVVQFVLSETITGQETELDELSSEVNSLAMALGLEQQRAAGLEDQVLQLGVDLSDAQSNADIQSALIATLTAQTTSQENALAEQRASITSFESQVAALLSQRDKARIAVTELEDQRTQLVSDQEALQLALAQARSEIDAEAETARLNAARRDALQALVADLQSRAKEFGSAQDQLRAEISDLEAKLTEEEAVRLAEAAAAEALRDRLKNADSELTAMTLALEEQRRAAEETLTLLAAANAARQGLDVKLAAALIAQEGAKGDLDNAKAALETALAETDALRERVGGQAAIEKQLASALAAKLAAEQAVKSSMTKAEERAVLLAAANSALTEEKAKSAEGQRKLALLNEQVAALRTQLGSLQAILDEASSRDASSQVQLKALGSQLNSALARVAAEEKRRAELEEAERKRLEAKAQDLERYRSEFFGRLRDVLGAQEGVRIEGDRFVFSSEVLFQPGDVTLSEEGRGEIAKVAAILRGILGDIPPEIDWVIRVDGHTDDLPLSGTGKYRDNWELSQGRALSVVRYMIDFLGIPPDRLAATGFGQYQPLATGDSDEDRAQNRRIELKFTEK